MADIRSIAAPNVQGKAAFYGEYFFEGEWHRVVNQAGNPIVYTTESYAIEAALHILRLHTVQG